MGAHLGGHALPPLGGDGFQFRGGGVKKSGQVGPDFGIILDGKTIWIEAVTPSPEGIPPEWLEPPKVDEVRVRTMPHEQMLLRWTSVIRDKRNKLESYLKKGVISPNDCTVIAVNSSRLSDFTIDDHGISQLPFAVEAVFPVGPLGIPVSKAGRLDGDPVRVFRPSVRKPTGAAVPTNNFLDPAYAIVSAVVGCSRRDMVGDSLPFALVHNPLALVPLPRHALGASVEFIA